MTVSSSVSPGTVVYVGECVDPVEDESDTSNNCSAPIKVMVTGQPDLVATVSLDSVSVAPGSSFEYEVEVLNRGVAAAPATRVRTFASEDSVVTRLDKIVGDASRVPGLGPGESVRGRASITASSSASPGTVVYLGECVDPVEGEPDTDNNCSSAIKLTIVATGSVQPAESPLAGRSGGSRAPEAAHEAVVRRAGNIEFQPIARGSRPGAGSACGSSSSPRTGASLRPTLCLSAGDFLRAGSRPPK